MTYVPLVYVWSVYTYILLTARGAEALLHLKRVYPLYVSLYVYGLYVHAYSLVYKYTARSNIRRRPAYVCMHVCMDVCQVLL